MKTMIPVVFAMFIIYGSTVKSQEIPNQVKSDADDFIEYYGYDEDYSKFFIRTNVSLDYGLCYYDPCQYYDEEQGNGSDYLTTIRFDPATGLNYDLYGGYHFNRFISATVGVGYFYGLNVEQTRTGETQGSTYNETVKMNASMFNISPGIELSPGFTRINPFIGIGVMIGICPKIMEKETFTSQYGNINSESVQTGVFHGGVPVGFYAKAGVDFKVSKVIDLFADINLRGLSYTPAKYSVKTYTINGEDQYSTLTTKQKETVFVKSYDQSEPIPSDSPNKQLKTSFPFTSLGLDLGVKFKLGSWERW